MKGGRCDWRAGQLVGRRVEWADPENRRTPDDRKTLLRALMIGFGTIALAVLGPLVWGLVIGGTDRKSVGRAGGTDETRNEVESAERVATAFLAGTDLQQRLGFVRNPDEIRDHLSEYSAAARSEPGKIAKLIGHSGKTTAFAVALASGEVRLLEVVTTPEGPKVDWDAYARYGTASWEELLLGNTDRAVVRVFCQPSVEAPEPFDAEGKWVAFRLSSPDLPQSALAFAETGTVRAEMMKKIVLGTPQYRQRFVVEVVRHEGKDGPLFEMTQCLAVGWIEGGRSVEETWAEKVLAVTE